MKRFIYRSNGQFNESKYLTEQEYQKLESHLKSLLEIKAEKRNASLILTTMFTGARAQEVLNIRKKDLFPEFKAVKIFGLKGSNNRSIPLPPFLFSALHELAADSKTAQIFDIGYQRFFQIWNGYRTTRKKLHALRHTFAIRLYRRTKDLRLVQKAMGHRQVNNTLIYLEYVHDQEDMLRILEL